MLFRTCCVVALVGCAQTAPNDVAFACGDAGSTCHSLTQYCEVVTTGGGVASDSGSSSSSTFGCAPLIGACTTCDCLLDAGALSCGPGGSPPSCMSNGSALTVQIRCTQ